MSDTYEQPDDEDDFEDIPEGGDDAPDDTPQGEEDDEDDLEISFDGEQPEEPDLVRHLRTINRAQAEELKRRPPPEEPKIEVGERPTLESCGYDEDELATQIEAWTDRRKQAEAQVEQARAVSRAGAEVIDSDLREGVTRYFASKKALKVPNYEAAEAAVNLALSETQTACLFQAVEGDAAKLIYALGRSPAKLEELAAIKNPVKFTAAIARLEGKVSVKPKKTAIDPDEPIRGSGRMTAAAADKTEQKLEEKAAKSGDRTELLNYRRDKKERLAARPKR